MISTSLSGIYFCGFISLVGAFLLRYHAEARYRFAAATMMMGAWLCTAGIAVDAFAKLNHQSPTMVERPTTVIASR